MTPKFSVGEVVILQSVNRPDLNGECTIGAVVTRQGQATEDRVHPAGFVIRKGERIAAGYVLQELMPYSTTTDGHKCELLWAESALRKKHQPGDMSFTELMVNLSQPVQAPSHS